jgi:trehalose synthase-fused probable maltokinase
VSRLSTFLSIESARNALSTALTESLPRQKWYARKGEAVSSVSIHDTVCIPTDTADDRFALLLVDVTSASATNHPDCYVIPVAIDSDADIEPAETLLFDDDHAVLECSGDPEFWQSVLKQTEPLIAESGSKLLFIPGAATNELDSLANSQITVSAAEQSNTAATLGHWGFLKLFRRVEPGLNPDIEIGRFLTTTAPHVATPQLLGTLELHSDTSDEPICLGVLLEQVHAESDAWQFTLNSLADFWQRVADTAADWPAEKIESEADASSLAEQIGPYLDAVRLLGRRTAELHSALAAGSNDAFRPEPLKATAISEQRDRVAVELAETCRLLRESSIGNDSASLAEQLLAVGNARLDEITQELKGLHGVSLIRVHGDYHLGQVLRTHDDFVIIDFEGEPDRPLAERNEKRCSLKDVAGMIRSLHYASNAASVGLLPCPAPSIVAPETWQKQWYAICRSAFLDSYFDSLTARGITPRDAAATESLLDLFVVEKALYELRYEINHRPDWIAIPLAGLNELFSFSD